ncbi:hypothetical protein PbJCM17693_51810 [Paenibacillus macerans]|nr:hypothetical protein PbJCM17693_51810 [Paenibacillus macerans]
MPGGSRRVRRGSRRAGLAGGTARGCSTARSGRPGRPVPRGIALAALPLLQIQRAFFLTRAILCTLHKKNSWITFLQEVFWDALTDSVALTSLKLM